MAAPAASSGFTASIKRLIEIKTKAQILQFHLLSQQCDTNGREHTWKEARRLCTGEQPLEQKGSFVPVLVAHWDLPGTDQTEQGSLTFELLYLALVSEAMAPSPALMSAGLVESSVLYQLPSCSCGALHAPTVPCHARWLERGTCRGQPAPYQGHLPSLKAGPAAGKPVTAQKGLAMN